MTERILQVVTSTDRRGAEVFALDLEGALRQRGRDVTTVALAPGDHGALPVPTLGASPRGLRTLRALRGAARDATVVIAHGGDTLAACGVALTGTGVPFVYRNIGDPAHWATSPGRRWQLRVLMRRAARVVAVSSRAAIELTRRLHVPENRVTVIPTGVSGDRFRPADPAARIEARKTAALPPDAPVVAVVAALSPEKNIEAAIDAVAALGDATLVIAGDGPQRAALEAHAHARAPGRVRFHGSLDDPRPVFAAADVVLLTSRTEGLPAVLIEAGLSAVPVVASDVGFVREVVVDGVTGLLTPAGDEPAVVRALRDALARHDMLGRAARDHCLAHFELASVASRWDSVLTMGSALRTGRG
jgi:glycosyltransferase involved in cell wall biosynthesis